MGFVLVLLLAAVPPAPDLEAARDAQDRAALQKTAADSAAAASRQPNDAGLWYRSAVAYSYLAEVSLELRDKNAARTAAEDGINAAQKAVALNGSSAENHRILGTLCGQVIPANTWLGLKYGQCALDEINKAVQLDSKSALAYLSRGIGNYYLPSGFGGGIDKAMADFQKALELNPRLADAHLWIGLAMRKANRNEEAKAEFRKAVELNPRRVWAKQQLEKTPGAEKASGPDKAPGK